MSAICSHVFSQAGRPKARVTPQLRSAVMNLGRLFFSSRLHCVVNVEDGPVNDQIKQLCHSCSGRKARVVTTHNVRQMTDNKATGKIFNHFIFQNEIDRWLLAQGELHKTLTTLKVMQNRVPSLQN